MLPRAELTSRQRTVEILAMALFSTLAIMGEIGERSKKDVEPGASGHLTMLGVRLGKAQGWLLSRRKQRQASCLLASCLRTRESDRYYEKNKSDQGVKQRGRENTNKEDADRPLAGLAVAANAFMASRARTRILSWS